MLTMNNNFKKSIKMQYDDYETIYYINLIIHMFSLYTKNYRQ